MNCKYCGAELVEGKSFCPACGKNQEETVSPEIQEAPKAKPGKIALVVIAVVLAVAVLATLVITGMNLYVFGDQEETVAPTTETIETQPTEPEVPATAPADGNPDDVTCKGSYSATNEEIQEAADVVVATAGDRELTNGLLQAYYWDGIYAFLTNYGDYVSLLGVDLSRSLDTQLCTIGDVSMTWQQYFLQYALDN